MILFRLTMLIALPAFHLSCLFANDTLNTVLISEGDRGLAMEKLLQFKGSETRCPQIGNIVYDTEGNIYMTVDFEEYMQFSNGVSVKSENMYVMSIMKFSPSYDLLWYKEIRGNDKTKNYDELNVFEVPQQTFYDSTNDRINICIFASTSDTINCDTLFYDNKKIGVLHIHAQNYNGTTVVLDTKWILSINAENGELEKCMPYQKEDKNSFFVQSAEKEGLYYRSTIDADFKGICEEVPSSVRSQGGNDWYFAKLSADFDLEWEYSVGGAMDDYLEKFQTGEEPEAQMYVFGDTVYITFPFQSDSVQINPDKSNPIYVYSSSYEFGMSGFGLLNEDAVIGRFLIDGDHLRLLNYRKVSWDSLPQNIRKDKDGNTQVYIYCKDSLEYGYPTLKHYELGQDLSMKSIDPYKGENSIYMHGFDNLFLGRLSYDDDYNYYENRYLYNHDWELSFSDSIKNYQYINKATGNMFVKYNSQRQFCYAYIMPIFVYAGIESDVNTGRLFVSGEGDLYYNVNGSVLNWNSWEKNQVVSSRENDGGLKSCFLTIYRETFRVKGESYGKGQVTVPDTLTWFGNDCEVQVVPDKGYRVDSVVTDRGDRLEAIADGRYTVPSVKDVVTVKAYFSEGSAVEENSSDDISIYPNPFTDGIDIVSEKDLRYEMMDARAAIVKTGAEKHVDARTLPQGLYVMRLYDGKELVKTKKIIKE